MNSFFERSIATLLSLFLITYTGYQAYRLLNTKYKTESTYSYTVSDTLKTRGIIVRDETVIDEMPNGIVDYLFEDGTKVSIDSPIAEVYQSESDVKNQKKVRAIEKEIKLLADAQAQAMTQTLQADAITKQINEQVGKLIDASTANKVDNIEEITQPLSVLINKKQIAVGKLPSLDSRISELETQKNYYSGKINMKYQEFKSPYSGYFVRSTDGFESIINTNNMEETTFDEYRKLVYEEQELDYSKIGKIILNHNWYLVVPASKEQIEKFKVGATVYLDFGIDSLREVPASIENIISDDKKIQNIIYIKCNYISPELVSLRSTDVKINFKSYTGLKVNSAAVRFKDNQKGVYIKQGHEIRFKVINPIYEEPGFVLCGPTSDEKSGLKLFDEVIVEGTELYDGKGIK